MTIIEPAGTVSLFVVPVRAGTRANADVATFVPGYAAMVLLYRFVSP